MTPEPPLPADVGAAWRWLAAVEDHIYKGLRERYHENLALVRAHVAQDGARARVAAIEECAVIADGYGVCGVSGMPACRLPQDMAAEIRILLPPEEAGPR